MGDEACTAEEYLRKHQLLVYIKDAVLAAAEADDPVRAFADHLARALRGQGVLGRDFGFVSATPHNRRMFLSAARRCFEGMSEAGPVTVGDCHSVLQLICSDFPAGTIKNAWNTALSIFSDSGATSEERAPRRSLARLPFADFLDCLSVTFLYERYLLEVRKKFFDANKRCSDLAGLEAAVLGAQAWAATGGWPAPPPEVLRDVVDEASLQGAQPGFEFRKLVRLICCHAGFRKLIEEETAASHERAKQVGVEQKAPTVVVGRGKGGRRGRAREAVLGTGL